MIIAKEKKKENIAEYILYMWQLEDLIRAAGFDMNTIEKTIISLYDQPEPVKEEIRNWYTNLIIMMKEEGITEGGHLQFVNNIVNDLNDLHLRLLEKQEEIKYKELFTWASKNIYEFRKKGDFDDKSDIEVCFVALYGYLMMKLKNEDLTEETKDAMSTFSNLLAILAKKYKLLEKGEYEL
jgi:hypothetical protein